MADHIVLIGMMGSGKTTVGRRVATRLGRPFVDSDEQVERATGLTVREIFERDGEAAFRAFEAQALAYALDAIEPSVVAAAGGVVLDPENRQRLKSAGTVVWLRASPATLAGRAARGDHRPLLGGDPLTALRRLDRERRPLYEEVAHQVVDVEHHTLGQVVDLVTAMVSA